MAITEAIRATEMEKKEPQRRRGRFERPRIQYGLPCADCRLYYPANLESCPVCNSVERVSAEAAAAYVHIGVAQPRHENL